MTSKICSLSVVLKKDVRDDDIEPLINEIKMLKNVLSVETHVSDYNLLAARRREQVRLRDLLFELIDKMEMP